MVILLSENLSILWVLKLGSLRPASPFKRGEEKFQLSCKDQYLQDFNITFLSSPGIAKVFHKRLPLPSPPFHLLLEFLISNFVSKQAFN